MQEVNYIDYDYDPKSGVNYYRLTQVDFDGKSETFYDQIRVVKFKGKKAHVKVYPNPTDGKQLFLSIEGEAEKNYEVSIYTSKGKIIKKIEINSSMDTDFAVQQDLLNGKNLAKGVYFIQVNDRNSSYSENFRVVIM